MVRIVGAAMVVVSFCVQGGHLHREDDVNLGYQADGLQQKLDSKREKGNLFKLLASENRFASGMRRDPKRAQELDDSLKTTVGEKNQLFQMLGAKDMQGQFYNFVEGLIDAEESAGSVPTLYGKETGNVDELAKNLQQDIRAHGMKGTVSSTEDFDVEELPNHKVLIIVISMCGLGEDPQNSKRIWMAL